MKVSELLISDCRKPENRAELEDKLLSLPFIKEMPTTDDLEKIMKRFESKYQITFDMIFHLGTGANRERNYCFHVVSTSSKEKLQLIYGFTLFECLAKSVIYCYAYTFLKKEGKKRK